MKIALIGATGFVGSHLLKEALSRKYQVTAIARHTEKIQEQNPLLTVTKANIYDTEAMAKILSGHDLVLSAFNPGWDNPEIYDDFLKGAESIEKATALSGVKRLLVIGGAGSLLVDGQELVDSPTFPAEFKPGALAARDYLNILKKNKTLDWTFFSPAIEMNPGITTGRTGKYRIGTDSPVLDANGKSILSVEDLAVAVLDEVENKKFIRKRFTAAY